VPGVWPHSSQKLRPHASLWRQATLGLVLASALPGHAAEVAITPAPVQAAPVHISDEGDRVLKGELKPVADRRSRANALYAQAMLLLEAWPVPMTSSGRCSYSDR